MHDEARWHLLIEPPLMTEDKRPATEKLLSTISCLDEGVVLALSGSALEGGGNGGNGNEEGNEPAEEEEVPAPAVVAVGIAVVAVGDIIAESGGSDETADTGGNVEGNAKPGGEVADELAAAAAHEELEEDGGAGAEHGNDGERLAGLVAIAIGVAGRLCGQEE